MDLNIFNLLTFFIIYSIAGWLMESTVRSMSERKFINTGFLKGPFCPIYGLGCIIMILFLEKFKDNILMLFLVCFIVLSVWEYIVGAYLEKTFHTKYWDYSYHRFNIKGRVCLTNSICWGLLGILFINYIHPFVQEKIILINPIVLKIIIYFVTIIFVIDTIISIIKTKNIKNTLDRVNELNNQIKEKLEEIKNLSAKKYKEEIIDSLQETIEMLNKKKDRIYRKLYMRVYRLKEAFPNIETKEITEILSQKIEKIKNIHKEKENK